MKDMGKVSGSDKRNWTSLNNYQKIGCSDSGDIVAKIATKELGHQRLACLQTFYGPDVRDTLNFVRRLRHHNLVDILEIFHDKEAIDNFGGVVLEFTPISVIDLCEETHTYLDELNLAAIIGQVCEGLSFLENAGLQNVIFTKTRVLADLSGNVKLRVDPAREPCYFPSHLLAFTQNVMFPWKFLPSMVEVEGKWPEDSDAMDFWNTLPSATTVGDLVKCPLLAHPWRTDHVRQLISLVFWQKDNVV